MKEPTYKAKSKKIIGFSCGQYDFTHFGHYLSFEEMKKQCDYLIIGLQVNSNLDRPEKHKPIQSLKERRGQLRACKWIDKIVIYERESDLVNLLKELKPNIRFLGEDWKGKRFTGDKLRIKVIYNSRSHNYSTTNLIKKIIERIKKS